MRPCQLCGCASWGAIGDPSEIVRMTEFALDLPAGAYVRCDNCKAIARLDLVQDAEFKPGLITPPSGSMPDFMSNIFERVMPAVPTSPTRLERLTVALLRSGMFASIDVRSLLGVLKNPDKTSVVIAIARDLERQLDQPITSAMDPSAKQPWLVLSFPARESFDYWLTGLWDAVNKADHNDFTTTSEYTEVHFDAAAAFAQDKKNVL